MIRALQLSVTAAMLLGALGCGPSVWERSFSYEPGAAPDAPTTSVVVREAPWERISAAMGAERETIAASDVHRDDWTAEQSREVELALLRALQLPVPPEGAALIGRSQFKTTSPVDPEGAELREFAQSVGAEYAVWTEHLLGKAETIEQEPVRRDIWRYDRYWDADRRRYVYVQRWEPETVWVPVVVERDEVWYVVFYVRMKDEG